MQMANTMVPPNRKALVKPKEPKVDLSIKATSAALHEKRRSIQSMPKTQFIQIKRPKPTYDEEVCDFDYQDTEQIASRKNSGARPDLKIKLGKMVKKRGKMLQDLEN